jgi:flagellar biosynthesis/type III secretory pathway protein FliH
VAIPCRNVFSNIGSAHSTRAGDLTVLLPAHEGHEPHPPLHHLERDLLQRLSDTVTELRAGQGQRLEEMQQVAVELAVVVAGQLVHEHINRGEWAVETLVRKFADQQNGRPAMRVYLHPDDLALLRERWAKHGLTAPDALELELMPDAGLSRGDCRAETGEATLVWKLRDQLTAMRQRLLAALPDAEAERRTTDRPLKPYPDRRQTA